MPYGQKLTRKEYEWQERINNVLPTPWLWIGRRSRDIQKIHCSETEIRGVIPNACPSNTACLVKVPISQATHNIMLLRRVAALSLGPSASADERLLILSPSTGLPGRERSESVIRADLGAIMDALFFELAVRTPLA